MSEYLSKRVSAAFGQIYDASDLDELETKRTNKQTHKFYGLHANTTANLVDDRICVSQCRVQLHFPLCVVCVFWKVVSLSDKS